MRMMPLTMKPIDVPYPEEEDFREIYVASNWIAVTYDDDDNCAIVVLKDGKRFKATIKANAIAYKVRVSEEH